VFGDEGRVLPTYQAARDSGRQASATSAFRARPLTHGNEGAIS
jgi:hypothetical protein